MPMKVTCLLLAAGLGRRFGGKNKLARRFGGKNKLARRFGGESKLLQIYKGKPIIAHSLNCLLSAKAQTPAIAEIIAVVGHHKDDIADAIPQCDNIFYNDRYREGLYTSLLCGLQNSSPTTDYMLVLPADMPSVSPDTITRIITTAAESKAKVFIPTAIDDPAKIGNPVLFHKSLQAALHEFKTEESMDSGAMGFFLHLEKTDPELICRLPVNDAGIFTDIDTQKDFLTLQS